MLKIARLHPQQTRQLTQAPSRAVTTHSLVLGQDVRSQTRKDMLDLYAQIDGNLGIVRMNREHRFNQLTPNMIENIARGVQSMDIDHIVSTIYLATHKHEHFCNGTDFRTIAHMKREDNYGRIKEYLEQVYGLQTLIAKTNKPLVAVAPGHSFNSGASLLAATGSPLVTLDSKVAFNEVTFGFVPHSGATYYMSRLPGEFGTFMALTGLPIHGSDAARIGLAGGIVHDPTYHAEEVADVIFNMPYPAFKGSEIFKDSALGPKTTEWDRHLNRRVAKQHELQAMPHLRRAAQQLDTQVREKFIEAKDRVGSSVADADFEYMRLLQQDSRANQTGEDIGYFEFGEGLHNRSSMFGYNNYYRNQIDALNVHIQNQLPHNSGVAVAHRELIDRCFLGKSVEQIMAALRKESDPFAAECLKAMERNSRLSMKLALEMVRKARNLDYRGCLQMELDVAMHKIRDADFDLGVAEVLGKPRKERGRPRNPPKWNKQIKDSTVASYFEPSEFSRSINLGIVENALLPTRHHYERFSDQVRLWLNEESTTDQYIRETFDKEAKGALREQGIDVRDKALSPEIARDHMAAKLAQERYQKVFEERSTQLMTDTKLREDYFRQIKNHLNQVVSSEQAFYTQVNKHVQAVFEDAYLDHLNTVHAKSKEAHNLEKRRMLVRFKKFLFRTRIMQSSGQENVKLHHQLQQLPFMNIHLTEKWDETYRDKEHPYLAESPIYHLSKAIGRVSLTQPELVKMYLTDPGARKQMSKLVIDKAELERLQKDILEDPEKYENLMRAQSKMETDGGHGWKRNREMAEAKIEAADYYYRMIHEGVSPMDDLPYAQEFAAYKDWAEQVETQAYNTLKFAVNSLLLQTEKTEEYSGKLSGLNAFMSDWKSERSKKRQINSQMGDKERDLTEVEHSLHNMLAKDAVFGHLFNGDDSNARVNKFRQHIKDELLRLVEIALLDKHGYVTERERSVLEQRLAALTTPAGFKEGMTQLTLIDKYLSQQNGEALVREAFDSVKPLFVKQLHAALKQEAREVMDQFDHEEVGSAVLFHYYLTLAHPKLHANEVLHKFRTWNVKREAVEAINTCVPFTTDSFKRRSLIQTIGTTDSPAGSDFANAQSSLSQTAAEIDLLNKFEERSQQVKAQLDKPDGNFEGDYMDENDTREIDQIIAHQQDIFDFLMDNKYEIDHSFQHGDWMSIYAKALLEMNFDMGAVSSATDQRKWEQLARYAEFLSGVEQKLAQVDGLTMEASDFVGQHNGNCLSQRTLYSWLLESKKRIAEEANKQNVVDRRQNIKAAIKDFNGLHSLVVSNSKVRADVLRLAETLPEIEKRQIEQLVESEYTNAGKLRDQLTAGSRDFMERPYTVMDVHRFVRENRDSLNMDTPIDAVSLVQAVQNINQDKNLSKQEKVTLKGFIDQVQQIAIHVANEDRKSIQLKDFIEKYHFEAPETYHRYSSDLLTAQIESVLGKLDAADDEQLIDWQVGLARTNPMDHPGAMKRLSLNKLEQVSSHEKNDQVVYEHVNSEEHMINQAAGVKPEEQDDLRDTWDSYFNRQVYDAIMLKHFKVQNLSQITEEMLEQIDEEALDNVKLSEEELMQLPMAPKYPEHDLHVRYVDKFGVVQNETARHATLKHVLREAREHAELPPAMVTTKNLYENKLISLMAETDMDEEKVNALIEDYIQVRLRGCMINSNFAKQVRGSENGHIAIKVLRENCMQELGLTEGFLASQMAYEHVKDPKNFRRHFDLENAYNTQSVNNTAAMGFDNLEKRALEPTAEGNFNAAHESVFDKLLADYFLAKRGDYKESNKLMGELASIFTESPGDPAKDLYDAALKQDLHKNEIDKSIQPEKIRDLFDLDRMTQRAIQKNKNGLSSSLRALSIKDTEHPDYFSTQIPDHFEVFDPRKPAEEYVNDKLRGVIQELFDIRLELEQSMTRRELCAFDKVLARYLQRDELAPRLARAVNSDYNLLQAGESAVTAAKEGAEDARQQLMKVRNDQRAYNKSIKNTDAQYKTLAFGGMLERKNQQLSEEKKDREAMFNTDSWEMFYRQELARDATLPAREIDMSAFEKRKPWEYPEGEYQGERAREEEFRNQHAVYLENKKEQQERIQLYYVLEQFFEETRTRPDPGSEAQERVREYFADPENTFFFDKNKIY